MTPEFHGCELETSISRQGQFLMPDTQSRQIDSIIHAGGVPPIKVTGVLVVPIRGLNLWIGTA